MDYKQRRRLSWIAIAVLSLPAFALFGYSLLHPAAPVKAGSAAIVHRTDTASTSAVPTSPWVMQESGTTAGLRGIYSVDGKVAWASGTGGTVLKTVDGGEHWTKCAVPDAAADGGTLDFRGVQAWDAMTAIVMASGPGEKSRLYKTVDGCGRWTLLLKNEDKDGFWDALRMWTPTDGFLAGDPETYSDSDRPKAKWLYVSEFTSWNGFSDDSVFRVSAEAKPGESSFAASNSSIALAPFQTKDGTAREVWFATGGTSGSRVIHYKHFNGGEPERVSTTISDLPIFPKTSSGGIFSISLRDDFRGMTVGGDYTKPNESGGTSAWTTDGGLTWTAATKPPHGYRSSVAWSELLKAWIAVGTNGSDISRDDGKTWEPLDDGNWNALSLPFVVGPNGRIARLSLQEKK